MGDTPFAIPEMGPVVQNPLGPEHCFIGPWCCQIPQIVDEGWKVSFVSRFQCIDVAQLVLGRDNRWKFPRSGIGHQHPEDPAIAILEGMNPDKFMVQSGRLHFRYQGKTPMPVVEGEELLHFLVHLFGRAILVDKSVPPAGIVGPYLVLALPEGNLDPLAEGCDAGCTSLVPGPPACRAPS